MNDLFPPVEPYRQGRLEAEGHSLYWEECGDPDGIPLIYLHGGPGAGITPAKRRYADPRSWRMVFLDQRGAGRSTPFAETRGNTTQALITDIEALRALLGIERWLVTGGSWGSALALAYGEAHPEACLGFLLRGVLLGTAAERDWFLNGMGLFFPEAHEHFTAWLPQAERDDVLSAYTSRLCGEDDAGRKQAAGRWYRYAAGCHSLHWDAAGADGSAADEASALATAKLQTHYFRHAMFLREGQLLQDLPRVTHLPLAIVQGRHDVTCPPHAAHTLHRAWPGSLLHMVEDGAHDPSAPGIASAIIGFTELFKTHRRFAA